MDPSISEFGYIHFCKQGFQSETNNRIGNIVDPEETAHYELFHLDLCCLHRYLFLVCRNERVKPILTFIFFIDLFSNTLVLLLKGWLHRANDTQIFATIILV